jgi:hypothetical protein
MAGLVIVALSAFVPPTCNQTAKERESPMKHLFLLATAICSLALLLASGCATNRGVQDITIAVPANPTSSKVVKIVKVTDLRKFEAAPRDPSVPSLRGKQVNNPAITCRAYARKRNGYGAALGDIVLPEGRTVEQVTRECLQKALREKGYSVPDGETADANAIPVEAEIQQFWAWMEVGFWSLSLQFEAIIKLKSPSLLQGGPEQTVKGTVLLHTQAASGSAWKKTVTKGLEDLNLRIKEAVVAP